MSTELQQISRLQYGVPIVEKSGGPTSQFQRLFNGLIPNVQLAFRTASAASTSAASKQDQDDDLDSLAALTGTGIAVRIADASWALRTITATVGHLTVADGDGVAGNPLISLPNSGVSAGPYTNADITVDAQGRVTAAANGSSGGGVLPLVDGSIPAVFIQNPDGSLVYGAI